MRGFVEQEEQREPDRTNERENYPREFKASGNLKKKFYECMCEWMCICVKQMCLSCVKMYRMHGRRSLHARRVAGVEDVAVTISSKLLITNYYCWRVSQRDRKVGVRRAAGRFRHSPSSSCSRFRASPDADRSGDFPSETEGFSARRTRIFLTFLSSLYETLLASPRLVVPAIPHLSNISVISSALPCPSLENASAIRNISEQRRGERTTLSRLDSRRRMWLSVYVLDGRTMPSANASIDYPNAYKKLMQFYVELNIYVCICIYIFIISSFLVLYHSHICPNNIRFGSKSNWWVERGKEYRMRN